MPSPFHSAPFRQFGAGHVVAATASSQNFPLPRAGQEQTLVVQNAGTTVAHIKTGQGAQTATTADNAVLPGKKRVLQLLSNETDYAVIMASSTATVYVACGDGVIT